MQNIYLKILKMQLHGASMSHNPLSMKSPAMPPGPLPVVDACGRVSECLVSRGIAPVTTPLVMNYREDVICAILPVPPEE